MNPIIRSAERAAYILDVSPQAFREQAKRGLNNYSKVVKGKNKKTYEFYLYIAAEYLRIPVQAFEKRDLEFRRRLKSD